MRTRAALIAFVGVLIATPSPSAQEPWTPPAFVSGQLPGTPEQAVGGGQVLLQADVGADGRVSEVTVLRATPPYTDLAVTAVRGWRFRVTGAAPVLVAYVARPPTLSAGPTLGAPPVDTAAPDAAVAFPTVVVTPEYPPRSSGGAAALVDVSVDGAGRITDAAIERSAGAFDAAALSAVRQWVFRPARVDGLPAATHVYVVFAWRPPVVASQVPR